jgi:hypothetical protein
MEANLPPHILIIFLLGGGLILFAPRNWILPAILGLTVFVSMGFNFYLFDLNFFISRVLLLFAWVRVLARGEYRGLQVLPMDRAFVAFCCSMVLVETLRRGWPGFVYSMANSVFDGMGLYFLGRVLLRQSEDIKRVIASLVVICSALAFFMLVENLTHRNLLTALGSVFEDVQRREGRMRCQATFKHPVLAGTYGAVLLPLFAACWWQGRGMRKLAIAGCLAATVITITAGSGGPVMTYAAVVVGACFWPLRHKMRPLRWCILLGLIGLHLMMNAPVWALIARVSSLTGGSGYHRFNLLDEFIRHVGDWWLLGIDSTQKWGWLLDDVANTYCIVAKHGGMLAVILFVRLLAAGFREVGLARREAENDVPTQILLWAFGACLFGHLVTFLGTSYFDQISVLWYVTLAMIGSLHLLPKAEVERTFAAAEVEEPGLGPSSVAGNQGIA